MKRIILFLFLGLILITGYVLQNFPENQTTNTQTVPLTQTNNLGVSEYIPEPSNTQTLQNIIDLCNSQCRNDKISYCKENKTITLASGLQTIGTCRSFSKYNTDFTRCQNYCKVYGHETGCTTIDAKSDPDCDGK